MVRDWALLLHGTALSAVLALRQERASCWFCLALAWDVRHTCAHFTQRKKQSESNTAGSCRFNLHVGWEDWHMGWTRDTGCELSLCAESVFGCGKEWQPWHGGVSVMSSQHQKGRRGMSLCGTEDESNGIWFQGLVSGSCWGALDLTQYELQFKYIP